MTKLTLAAALAMALLNSAVRDPSRLDEHVLRDAGRKPAEMLDFAGVEPGDRILELVPGAGYYTALLSRAVGDTGEVVAVNPQRIFEHFPQAREGFPGYLEQDPRDNVSYSVQRLDELNVSGSFDQVWMVLYYHDTLWTGTDRGRMNRLIYDALKPGGTYFVIDHRAPPGAPESVGRELHRMDETIARREILAAGFVLHAESDLLDNAEDPLTDSVFGADRRGNTSRFVYRFRKQDPAVR